ncbi:MAG: type II secretion system protein [Thermoguttaceae bacterium]
MNAKVHRSAFTLIEVLIVVIIMALLAATIIPQFSSSTSDAKKSALNFNLHTLRSQIEMYKVHHNGAPPKQSSFADQMTKKTNVDGSINAASGLYGPYFQQPVPANPYNNSNALFKYTASPTGTPPSGSGDTGASGWQYDETDGSFYPNHTGYDYANQTQP